MPRPKKEGAPEPKKRSRNGCWPCKARKVKCDEERPVCKNCQRQGETCDYSIRLNWGGRSKKGSEDDHPGTQTIAFAPSSSPSAPPPQPPPQIRSPATGHYSSPSSTTPSVALHADPYNALNAQPPRASNYYTQDQMPTLPPIVAESAPQATAFSATSLHGGASSQIPAINWSGDPDYSFPPASGSSHSRSSEIPLPPTTLPYARPLQPVSPYPSPAESGLGSPTNAGLGNALYGPGRAFPPMAPPYPTSNPAELNPNYSFPPAKRVKLSPPGDSLSRPTSHFTRSSSYGPGESDEVQRPSFQPLTPTFLNSGMNNPLTPAASSSAGSDEVHQRWMAKRNSSVTAESTGDIRRVSVNSLLSGSPEPEESRPKVSSSSQPPQPKSPPPNNNFIRPASAPNHRKVPSRGMSETYGVDRGLPDLDVPKNNDPAAISAVTPSEHGSDLDVWLNSIEATPEFGFGLQKRERVFGKGGYYAQPVPIIIPRSLEPLPPFLLQNPMNLLYFHHFLNHTARILVPHDCSENPFKTVLPQMAVQNSQLLHLLLAYSASHRARLLGHPEPANRIAHWVRDVFPSLRQALNNLSPDTNTPQISNANLATAIMLASLEIISPSTFGISIPWQDHLGVARSIILARGDSPGSISKRDPVPFFLTRWFAYLDVLGSLSGRNYQNPLFDGKYWADDPDQESENAGDVSPDAPYTIDCLLGFTPRCVALLAQVASLARKCDAERLDPSSGTATTDYECPASYIAEADKLRIDIEASRKHIHRPCPHRHSPAPGFEWEDEDEEEQIIQMQQEANRLNPGLLDDRNRRLSACERRGSAQWDAQETLAVNMSFHWAGLLHLYRRVYLYPRANPEVQEAVRAIISSLSRVRRGGTAEACLLFPMFSAGCDAIGEREREEVRGRVKGVEEVGLMHVRRAREVMEWSWETGRGWEEVVGGEFFG
ncbi:MAG: hypothetical protein Q9227_002118 [Pyrenula ochraceoflavens]